MCISGYDYRKKDGIDGEIIPRGEEFLPVMGSGLMFTGLLK
jgi:hypothetical protein